MRGKVSALAAALLALVYVGVTASGAATGDADPPEPKSFALAIGNGHLDGGGPQIVRRLGGYDIVVVDGEEAARHQVEALEDQGTEVLAYLSVGTIEGWRSWFPRLKRYRLAAWKDWKDEWYADVSKAAFRREIYARIVPELMDKGFSGIFLDNVDMIEAPRHAGQREGMRILVRNIAGRIHSDGGFVFAQNGREGLERYGILADGSLDGWNREDVTSTWDFDRRRYVHTPAPDRRAALADLRIMHEAGLITTATSYMRRSRGKPLLSATRDACSVGALPFAGDIGLTEKSLPAEPLTCP